MNNYTLDIGLSEKPLEMVSGDISLFKQNKQRVFIAMLDVAGHGEGAHQVALKAHDFIEKNYQASLTELIQGLHKHIKREERGLVIMCAWLNLTNLQLTYSGMGNTQLRIFGTKPSRALSLDGVVGYIMSTPHEHQLQLQVDDLLLFYTDGISSNFNLTDYPNMLTDSASCITKTVLQQFGKSFDDQCCMAIKVHDSYKEQYD